VWAERPAAPAGKTEQCGMDQVPARPCGGRAARREFGRRAAATRANEDQQRGRAAAVAGWWRQRRLIGGAGGFFLYVFPKYLSSVSHTANSAECATKNTQQSSLCRQLFVMCPLS